MKQTLTIGEMIKDEDLAGIPLLILIDRTVYISINTTERRRDCRTLC